MPWPVSLVHFDACVNMGVTQAARFLQRSVGAEPDGRIGPKTLEALRALLERETPLAVAEFATGRKHFSIYGLEVLLESPQLALNHETAPLFGI
jgi:lysozyme family protein